MSTLLNKREHLKSSSTAYAKATAVKSSVQKLNLVAELIRGKKVVDAKYQLEFSKKKVSKDISAVLNSAISNAENNFSLDVDKLFVSEILIGKSFTLKRFQARGRGRASKIMKPYSKVVIFVSERE